MKVKYPVDRDLDERTDELYQDSQWNYLEYLEENDDGVWIGNVFVDLRELVDRNFLCTTKKCMKVQKNGKVKGLSCCCHYDVQITQQEKERIEEMPGLVESLEARKGAPVDLYDNFVRNEDFEIMLAKDKSEACSFSFIDARGELFCGIHAHALDDGLDLKHYKPSICQIFPLSYVELDDDRHMLSVLTENNASAVTDDPDNYQPIGCLTKVWKGDPPLYQGMRQAIIGLFGAEFYAELDLIARERLSESK